MRLLWKESPLVGFCWNRFVCKTWYAQSLLSSLTSCLDAAGGCVKENLLCLLMAR